MKLFDLLKSSKQTFDINKLPEGMVVIEQDGKIININEVVCELFEQPKFEIIGKYFSDFIEGGNNILNNICQNNKSQCAKSLIKNEEDGNKIFEISAKRDIENSKVYIIIRNSTQKEKEQKKITQKYSFVQNALERKNNFILEASGMILSSLVSIGGFSKALLDGMGGVITEKQEKYLRIINNNARDLNYDLEKLFSLFKLESRQINYSPRAFDLMSMIKSIERIYQKDFQDRKILFTLNYTELTQRDCFLDSEVVEYILRCTMDIFQRFALFGKCSLNIGHPPKDFLNSREFEGNTTTDTTQYVLFEAKIADLIFSQDELDNIFNMYYKSAVKRPIGLRASLNLMKLYINDFKGEIWVYSKETFGTMITFVLPLK